MGYEEDDIGLHDREETIEEVDDVEESDKVYPVGQDEESSDTDAIADDDIEDLDDRELIKASDKAAKREKAIKKPKQQVPAIKKKAKKAVKKVAKKNTVKKIKKVVVKKVKKVKPKKVVNAKTKMKHKDKKDRSKLGKRGPKGPQWKNWHIPYQESSVMGKLFTEGSKKGGIKIKDIIKIAKKYGANPQRALKYLRSGHSKGWVWDVDDSYGRVRVSKPRIGDKHWEKD